MDKERHIRVGGGWQGIRERGPGGIRAKVRAVLHDVSFIRRARPRQYHVGAADGDFESFNGEGLCGGCQKQAGNRCKDSLADRFHNLHFLIVVFISSELLARRNLTSLKAVWDDSNWPGAAGLFDYGTAARWKCHPKPHRSGWHRRMYHLTFGFCILLQHHDAIKPHGFAN
jgi:hypothetical protein